MIRKQSIKANVIANAFGSGWTAIMNIVFIPIYIYYIKSEGYGLVGIFSTMLIVMSLLDLGIGAAINRELAVLSINTERSQEIRNLVFSSSLLYWSISLLLSILAIIASPFLATHWVNTETLSPELVTRCFYFMSLALLFRFPLSFYSGCLLGLQKQVSMNVINVIGITIRSVGAVLVLKFFNASVFAFFVWQFIASVIHVALAMISVARSMPNGVKGKFQKSSIRSIRSFAAGLTAISLTALIISQLDKVILSKMLTLSDFGYYTFAFSVSTSLGLLANLVPQALYPRLSQLASVGNENALKTLYRNGYSAVAALLIPIAVFVFCFLPDLLLVWTRNPALISNTLVLTRMLLISATLQALMVIPYTLSLARGFTSITLRINLFSIVLLVPLLYFFAGQFQARGAAVVWIILTAGYHLIGVPLIHRVVMKGENIEWYKMTFGLPLIIPVILMGTVAYLTEQWGVTFLHAGAGLLSLLLSMALVSRFNPYLSKMFAATFLKHA